MSGPGWCGCCGADVTGFCEDCGCTVGGPSHACGCGEPVAKFKPLTEAEVEQRVVAAALAMREHVNRHGERVGRASTVEIGAQVWMAERGKEPIA